ncbi:hypothetical protein ACQR2B_10675 [Bradyrhizobium oligotrophicum]|uniref:hypothetical protein n=1 Tax=Bradyrhizobium TaxID=374 RepID=UPI003EB7DD58
MAYSEQDLRAAAGAGAIGPDELQRLLTYLEQQAKAGPAAHAKFDAAHLLWYAGALIVIGAMGLFSTVAFSQMGGRALTACALAYAAAFGFAGDHLWRRSLRVPGGLLIAIAVSMAPLAVYGVQAEFGWWGKFGKPGTVHDFYVWIKGSWLFMEIATIAAGAIALRFYRVPFIVAIMSVALWFMSMDLTPWIFNVSHFDWEMRRIVSIWFGLGILAVAWIVDYTSHSRDFGFWLHLFGLMAFWGGVSATEGATEPGKAIYCLLNVGLLAIAVIIVRRAYAVFGAIGITMYLGHLADVVFKDSLLFPFALSLIGIAVVAVGLAYHRKQRVISEWLTANLPAAVLRLRPQGALG